MRAVSAQGQSTNQDSLVNKLSSSFNLNKDEVQKVFDQHRESLQAKRKAKAEERLKKAVKSGEITQDQANKINLKIQDLVNFKISLKDKPKEERHKAMKAKKNELRQWAKDNSVPEEYLHIMLGHKHNQKHNKQNFDEHSSITEN